MPSDILRDRLLSAAVPIVSFGGIVVAVSLAQAGWIQDAGSFVWGCVAGSVVLAYLAYVKPRRDIVSLFAPLYALLIFIVPMEMKPNLLTQVLFAASLTALVIRLNVSFSKKEGDARTAVPDSD
jgi:hypothetical protein